MSHKKHADAAEENKAPAAEAQQDGEKTAAPAAQNNAPPAPTPEQINAMMEGHKKVLEASGTMVFMSNQAQQMLNMLTQNNPRMNLAIANEMVLINSEVIRRQLVINATDKPFTKEQQEQAAKEQADPTLNNGGQQTDEKAA